MKLKIKNPDAFGELMRDTIFVDSGFGCYSQFDVEPEFKSLKDPEDELAVKMLRAVMAEDGDYELDALGEVEFMQDYPGIRAYSNGTTHCMWFWDGDGTLFVANDELKLAAINTDCKKSYGWKWVPWS